VIEKTLYVSFNLIRLPHQNFPDFPKFCTRKTVPEFRNKKLIETILFTLFLSRSDAIHGAKMIFFYAILGYKKQAISKSVVGSSV